jgi:hypothetical protein
MTDEEFRDTFHRFELRLERLDTKVENLEKGLADVRAEMRGRFEGIENRLARKADTWVVTAGIGGIGVLMTLYEFFL